MNHLCAAPFVKICGHHATAVAPIALPVDHNAGRALAKAVNVCLCAGIVFRVFMYLCIYVLLLLLFHFYCCCMLRREMRNKSEIATLDKEAQRQYVEKCETLQPHA